MFSKYICISFFFYGVLLKTVLHCWVVFTVSSNVLLWRQIHPRSPSVDGGVSNSEGWNGNSNYSHVLLLNGYRTGQKMTYIPFLLLKNLF